jgi:hypothetical protein
VKEVHHSNLLIHRDDQLPKNKVVENPSYDIFVSSPLGEANAKDKPHEYGCW